MPDVYEGSVLMSFSWRILIDGLEAALAQRVQLPDVEVAEAKIGGIGRMRKIPGAGKFGDCTIEKLKFGDRSDRWAWERLKKARNPNTGETSGDYELTFDVEELGEDGETIINRHTMKGWVKIVRNNQKDKNSETDTAIETVVISVNEYDQD